MQLESWLPPAAWARVPPMDGVVGGISGSAWLKTEKLGFEMAAAPHPRRLNAEAKLQKMPSGRFARLQPWRISPVFIPRTTLPQP